MTADAEEDDDDDENKVVTIKNWFIFSISSYVVQCRPEYKKKKTNKKKLKQMHLTVYKMHNAQARSMHQSHPKLTQT